MKSRLLRLALVSLAGVSLISLAGCGQNTDAAKASKVAFVATSQNSKQQVWYRLDTPTPQANSQVKDILIQQKGMVTDYRVTNIAFSDVNRKGTSQVIKIAKNNQRETFNKAIASKRTNYRDTLKLDKTNQKNSNQYTYKKGIAQANSETKQDLKLANQFSQSTKNLSFKVTKAYPATAKIIKNKSGKQVIGETITLKAQKWQYGTNSNGTVKQVASHLKIPLSPQNLMAKPVTINGSKYIGYYGSPYALITKTTNAKAQANFDTPRVHGVH